jgi:hypothetical protein
MRWSNWQSLPPPFVGILSRAGHSLFSSVPARPRQQRHRDENPPEQPLPGGTDAQPSREVLT